MSGFFSSKSIVICIFLTFGFSQAMDETGAEPSETYQPKRIYSLMPSMESESLSWIMNMERGGAQSGSIPIDLPPKADFSNAIQTIHEQGKLSSCTAHALTLAMEYNLLKQKEYTLLSPLFVYYNERKLMGTTSEDSGATLADGVRSICTWGACRESLWKYSVDQRKYKAHPPQLAYADAKNYMDLDHLPSSHIPHSLEAIKAMIAQNIPVVFGISIFPSFESDEVERTGKIPMPGAKEQRIGGHALMFVGYDDEKKEFKFANSWGKQWGDKGFGYLKYDYVMNVGNKNHFEYFYSGDIWSVNKIGKEVVLPYEEQSLHDSAA